MPPATNGSCFGSDESVGITNLATIRALVGIEPTICPQFTLNVSIVTSFLVFLKGATTPLISAPSSTRNRPSIRSGEGRWPGSEKPAAQRSRFATLNDLRAKRFHLDLALWRGRIEAFEGRVRPAGS